MTEPISYKDTLNLPKTNFDMKANLTQREPAMLAAWQKENLYQKIRARSHPKGKWILHDGPPYANGDIHMGHLINKVLKDIVVKFRTMQGHDAPYIPGWDCHGLPIESAIQKELGPKFRELTKDQVRQKCHDYAMKYVKLQSDSFARLGVFFGPGDQDRYLTLNPQYEAGTLDVLAELVQRDLVYRKKKPVHWCTNDRTALAEAELEYANRKDTSIYVTFRLAQDFLPAKWRNSLPAYDPAHPDPRPELMIWTTTPWTLPANRAVAIHPDQDYVCVSFGKPATMRYVVLAAALAERVMKLQGITDYLISPPVSGRQWIGTTHVMYLHPLDPQLLQRIVLANYVTVEDGTGIVHIAPGHGKEDYEVAIHHLGIEVYNPVLPDGRYDDTVPAFLRGQSIWAANDMILDKLKETGALFHHQQFEHEYPHCWRCRKPVIFRATEQWFIDVDKSMKKPGDRKLTIREQAESWVKFDPMEDTTNAAQDQLFARLAEEQEQERKDLQEWVEAGKPESAPSDRSVGLFKGIKYEYSVKFIPEWGANRLNGMLLTRPDWCISRQRSWGVPIPALINKQGEAFLNLYTVKACANYFREHGADSWYTDPWTRIFDCHPTDPTKPLDSDYIAFIEFAGRSGAVVGSEFDEKALDKGSDILDVWFESGASHHAVMECTHAEELNKRPPGEKPSGYPADLYLEGSDQHRGWFQSTLLEAAGYRPEPPYKQVLTHGFVVDEKGRKMSKSEGNDIKVDAALRQYGADVLRLWVASVDYQNDIPCGPHLLAKTGEAYRKIRNTIRYLLGNLYDFNPITDSVEPDPHSIDSWMEMRLKLVFLGTFNSYQTYEFHQVFKALYEFCNVDISALYAKAIKDRLYCDLPNSRRRRMSQTMCYRILVRLLESLAPILPFTMDEVWETARLLWPTVLNETNVHLRIVQPFSDFEKDVSTQIYKEICDCPDERNAIEILRQHLADAGKQVNEQSFRVGQNWRVLWSLIEQGNHQLDDLKRSIGLGNALDAEAVIILPKVEDEVSKLIADYGPEIEDALGVGFHRIEHGETWDIKILDTREKYPSCARSWKRRPDVGSDKEFSDLSARDAAVVRALRGK